MFIRKLLAYSLFIVGFVGMVFVAGFFAASQTGIGVFIRNELIFSAAAIAGITWINALIERAGR